MVTKIFINLYALDFYNNFPIFYYVKSLKTPLSNTEI